MYIYLLVHLLNTPLEKMNGIETFIFQKYMAEDQAWIPVNTAKALSNRIQDEEKTLEDQIDRLHKNVEKIEVLVTAKPSQK